MKMKQKKGKAKEERNSYVVLLGVSTCCSTVLPRSFISYDSRLHKITHVISCVIALMNGIHRDCGIVYLYHGPVRSRSNEPRSLPWRSLQRSQTNESSEPPFVLLLSIPFRFVDLVDFIRIVDLVVFIRIVDLVDFIRIVEFITDYQSYRRCCKIWARLRSRNFEALFAERGRSAVSASLKSSSHVAQLLRVIFPAIL